MPKFMMIGGAMVGLFGLMMLGCRGEQAAAEEEGGRVRESGFGVSVATDRAIYTVGEPVTIELRIFNRTGEEITLNFRDAQRYDFILEDKEENKVWQWSEGMMFAQMLDQEALGSGKEELTYSATCEEKLSPGKYKVTGVLFAQDKPMSGNIAIVVK
jgi:hypothetical protein